MKITRTSRDSIDAGSDNAVDIFVKTVNAITGNKTVTDIWEQTLGQAGVLNMELQEQFLYQKSRLSGPCGSAIYDSGVKSVYAPNSCQAIFCYLVLTFMTVMPFNSHIRLDIAS
jgi:hypothetical protein